jgi:hypothetical protein
MKIKITLVGIISILILINFTSCWDSHNSEAANPFNEFMENPVSIKWYGDSKEGLQSYQADVKVYSQNNRTDINPKLQNSYRLAIKTIGQTVYTRIDFDSTATLAARSAISDGKEMIIFDPLTDTIEYRLPLDTEETPFLKLLTHETGLTRINLNMIRDEARRLSLNMIEEGKGKLLLELPNNLFPANQLENVIRHRVSFNLDLETLCEVEIIKNINDGRTETTTITPIYELNDGVPIKVGMLTVINSKAASLIEGFPDDRKIYNSIDDIPTMSLSDYEKVKDAGNVMEIKDLKFGDPADLSYKETILEIYQDIEVNNVPDGLFRLIFN